jgi:lysyl-tRNA synthetase class I
MKVKDKFPHIKVKCIRNSSMKNNLKLKYYLLKTIKEPHIVLNAIKKYTNKKTLNSPISYAMAVCPKCHLVRGKTDVMKKDVIRHFCGACGSVSEDNYEKFDYWFYHKVLALPRLDIFNIDLCITGLDHYNEGDFLVRKKLIEDFGNNIKLPKTLYAPTILGSDGRQMGKSKGNDVSIEIDDLVNLISSHDGDKIIIPLKKKAPLFRNLAYNTVGYDN